MKKIFIFIISAILSIGTLCSCGRMTNDGASSSAGGNSSSESSAETVVSEYQKNPIVTLNAFETQKDLSLIAPKNNVGKITLNDDAKYVSQGEGSAKVCITKNQYWWTSGAPQLYNAMINEFTGQTYSDFSYVSMLSLDVFNAEDRAVKVGLQLVYSSSSSGVVQWYDVEAGQKAQLSYNIVREFLPDASSTNPMKRVIGVNFIFERFEDKDCTLYLDNYRLYKTNKPIETVARSIEENEINSFDSIWQYNALQTTATVTERLPKLTWVKDVVSPNQVGGGAIKVESAAAIIADSTVSWEGLVVPAAALTECDFGKFSEDGYFCFDFYSPYDCGVSELFFSMFGRSTQYFSVSFANGFVTSDKYPLNKGVWQTYAFKISDLNAGPNVTETVNFASTNKITFSYRTSTSKNVCFYVDNLRIESTMPEGAIS